MTIAAEPRGPVRGAETVRRRWRLGVLLGLVAMLAMAGFAVVLTLQNVQANHVTAVLKVVRDIQAGTVISDDEIGVSYVRIDDPAVLGSMVDASQRSHVVGQVATLSIRAGSLVPAELGTSQTSAGLWDVPLTVKRMPPDLKPGDHVALVVSTTARTGEPIEFVAVQDVRVLSVGTDSVSLWLPASATAQMEWYADHGGLVVARMQPGTVQQSLPAGGAGS